MSGGDWKDLYDAALCGDLPRVRYQLHAGVDPDYQHPEVMCTPLVAALQHGHDAVARHLIAHGADPNLRSDFDDLTPLEAAQRHGRTEMAALLRERGATSAARRPLWRRWLPF